jgi:hypothetical protein
LQPVFFDWESMRNSTGLPVIGRVQLFRPVDEWQTGMRAYLRTLVGAGSLIVTFAVVVAFSDSGSRLVRSILDKVS